MTEKLKCPRFMFTWEERDWWAFQAKKLEEKLEEKLTETETKSLKVFHCSYYWHGNRGAFEEIETIVVAECESVALGLALTEYPSSSKEDWSVTEIKTDKQQVTEISMRCS